MATPRTPKPDGDAIEEAVVLPEPPTAADPAPDAPPVMIEVDEPAEAEPPSSPPPAPARRSGGVLALVLGGVIAAGAGFVLSQVVPMGWPLQADTALADRLAAAEAGLARLSAEVAKPAAPAPAPNFGPVEARLDELALRLDAVEEAARRTETALAALPAPSDDPSPRIDALEGRLAAIEALPPGSVVEGGGDPAAVAALRTEIETLRTQIQAPDGPAQAAVAEVAAAAEAAKAALADATAQAAALKSEAEAAAQEGRMQAALGRMRAALESGLPFASAVAEVQSAGIEVPEVLAGLGAGGIPTLSSLRDRFPDAARRALDDSLRADLGDSTVERLGSFLRTQVGARSLEPREGTDPDAVLSRAEAALAAGQLADAVAELGALPEPGKAAMADWTADAQRRLDAAAAVDALAVTLDEGRG